MVYQYHNVLGLGLHGRHIHIPANIQTQSRVKYYVLCIFIHTVCRLDKRDTKGVKFSNTPRLHMNKHDTTYEQLTTFHP